MSLVKKILSESDMFSPRRINNRDKLKQEELNRILSQKIIKGDLDLSAYKDILTSLGNIEIIEGDLTVIGCNKLESFNNLKIVLGDLEASYCSKLKDLGKLEKVTGFFNLGFCERLITLGNLEEVHGSLDVSYCFNLTSLENLRFVEKILFLNSCSKLESSPKISTSRERLQVVVNKHTNKLVIKDIKEKNPSANVY